MRRMKRFLAFGSIFVLSFALLMIAMPYVMKLAVKSSAGASEPGVGRISYFKADLFDYEPSKRSVNGNFLLGKKEYATDSAFVFFNLKDINESPEKYNRQRIPMPGEHNSWVSSYKYKVVDGLVDKKLSENGTISLTNNRIAVSGTTPVKLFDSTNSRTYKGAYSFPFVNVGDGYLRYDSSKNHVQVTKQVGEDKLLMMDRFDGASKEGFMPFNKVNTSLGKDENGYYALSGNKNFCFGSRFEIPFIMSKGGKVITASGKEKDMMFEFAGSGELWVYVDGVLVLDIGGIHNSAEGKINFSKGVVTVTGNHLDERTMKYNTQVSTMVVEDTFIKSLSVGRHKLQVFYLERGGLSSDCSIRFRLKEDKTPKENQDAMEDFVGPRSEEEEAF